MCLTKPRNAFQKTGGLGCKAFAPPPEQDQQSISEYYSRSTCENQVLTALGVNSFTSSNVQCCQSVICAALKAQLHVASQHLSALWEASNRTSKHL